MIADSDNAWVGAILIVLAPWALGDACLARSSSRGTERFGVALLLGQLVVALATLALMVFGVPFPRIVDTIALCTALAMLAGAWLKRRSSAPAAYAVARPTRSTRIFDMVAGGCALLIVARIAIATASAITDGDELFIWAAKARHFLTSGSYFDAVRSITGPSFSAAQQPAHPDYPSLGPLLEAFAMASSPSHSFVVARLPIAMFDLGLLALLHGAWRRSSWLPASVALSTVFLSTNYLAQEASADRMLVVGVACAWIGLTRWSTGNRQASSLWLVSLGTLIAVWSKSEGQLHLISLALATVVMRAPLERRMVLAWIPPLLAIGLMWAVNAWVGLSNDLVKGAADAGLSATLGRFTAERGLFLLKSFGSDVILDLGTTGGMWMLAVIVSLLTPTKSLVLRGTWIFVGTSTLGFLFVLGSTHYDLAWHWSTAHSRIFLFAVPIMAHLVITLDGQPEPTGSDNRTSTAVG